MSRPHIPAEIKRKVLVEAGHRCAIPTCRFPTTEVAHIKPYSESPQHNFHNLIALCPNCHTRYDRGEIDRLSMRAYKQKISFLSDRYSKYELNVLHYLRKSKRVSIHGVLQVKNLLDEGLIENVETCVTREHDDGEEEILEFVASLTPSGRTFFEAWDDPSDRSLSYEDGA